jgi:hypothetical protein
METNFLHTNETFDDCFFNWNESNTFEVYINVIIFDF